MQKILAAFAATLLVLVAAPAVAQTTAGASPNIVVPVTAQTASIGADFRIAKSYGTTTGYVQGGNSFGATAILGTIDKQPLEFRIFGDRVMRYEPTAGIPNAIGGSPVNIVRAGVAGGTIVGGGARYTCGPDDEQPCPNGVNLVAADAATVVGGVGNTAGGRPDQDFKGGGDFSTLVGGTDNAASGLGSTITGSANTALGPMDIVFERWLRIVGGNFNTVFAGGGNIVGGNFNTVVGAGSGIASGDFNIISGGDDNTASGTAASVVGGLGNDASGRYSTAVGGYYNTAFGDFSFVSGWRARSLYSRSFVWGGIGYPLEVQSIAHGDFVVNSSSAVRMMVGAGECVVTAGSSGWSCTSDRRLKSDVDAVDRREVLDRIVAMPVTRWTFASVPGVLHMGPMAQDFHAAFNLGDDETRLAPMDVQGIALAAIQGLNAELEARLAEEWLAKQAQADEIAELKRLIEMLIARTAPVGRIADAH